MSKKDYLNFPDSASTPTLSKKSTTLLLGLLLKQSSNLEKKQKSGRLFHTLIASITVAQSIVLVILGTVVYQIQKDFYFTDGTKHSRGKIGDAEGEWRDRSRKHRYVMVFDKKLDLLWTDQTSVVSNC